MTRAFKAALAAFACSIAAAQSTEPSPTFEVASVKPAAPPEQGRMMMGSRSDAGRVSYTNLPLKSLLMTAYGLKAYQISGPAWLDTERFDIVATHPPGATKDQVNVMLQNLLVERFKLVLHREQKEVPIFTLVVGKNGHKLKESAEVPAPPAPPPSADGAPPPPPLPPSPPRISIGPDGVPQLPRPSGRGGPSWSMRSSGSHATLQATAQTTQRIADILTNQLGRPVTDKTGLTGKYDFTLDFAPEPGRGMMGGMGMMGDGAVMAATMLQSRAAPPPSAGGGAAPGTAPDTSEPGGTPLIAAVQQQLGLRLEPGKGPVDMLVIERGEKVPIEN